MSKYRWIIKTSDDLYSGSGPGQVFLSLHGLDAAMRETEISSTRALKQFQKGSEETGILTIQEHLGSLQTGTLRSTGKWKVDWVSVTSLDGDDGRSWFADVSRWDADGKFPVLRFEEVAGPPAPSSESNEDDPSEDEADQEEDADESEKNPKEPQARPRSNDKEVAALQASLDELNRKLKLLELRRQIEMKRRLVEQVQRAETVPRDNESAPSRPSLILTTLELIAKKDGRKVPFTEAVLMLGGEVLVLPGVDFFVGDSPEDGYGLGGDPGGWNDLYPDRPPESMGLDRGVGILVFDGNSGHAIDPHTLSELFGADWRKTLYSAQLEENDT